MQEFNNITVVPSFDRKGPIFRGGPIWPDWDEQVTARHCRNRIPLDIMPDLPSGPIKKIEGSMIWGGPVYWQFGHQVAEFSTRYAQSTAERGDGKFIFGVMPQMVGKASWEVLPGHFHAIADWFGISQDIAHLCQENMEIENLRVADQGEQLGRVGPTAQYLDLLDDNWDRKGIRPKENEVVFVSRAKLPLFFGGHAGASYLDRILVRSGVKIIYPEQLSLVEQMKIYKGAKTLIFSEGSALHGLQLLGRGLGSVYVLNRRRRIRGKLRRMAVHQINPRVQNLSYLDAIETQLFFYAKDGTALENSALSIFDPEFLLTRFEKIGVDIKRFWNQDDYEDEKGNDVLGWLSAGWKKHGGRLNIDTQEQLLADLKTVGLGHMTQQARETIVRKTVRK